MVNNLIAVKEYLEGLDDGEGKRLLAEYNFSKDFISKMEKDIKYLEEDNYPNGYTKGRFFEEFTSNLLAHADLFEIVSNIHTSTNEIDLHLRLTAKGNLIRNTFYSDIPSCGIIGECKNYNKKIGVTWIGKFFSLISSHNFEMGILFSKHGVSGQGWHDGRGLIKKIALRDKIMILDISLEDVKKAQGINILDLLREKYISLHNDIDYQKYIGTHPGQESK